MLMKEPVILRGVKIGEIDLEKAFYLSHRTQAHYFHKFEGFGISIKVLDYLMSKKVEKIGIIFENREFYYANIDSFLIHGIEYDDNGDIQLILPLKFYTKYKEEIREEVQVHL